MIINSNNALVNNKKSSTSKSALDSILYYRHLQFVSFNLSQLHFQIMPLHNLSKFNNANGKLPKYVVTNLVILLVKRLGKKDFS